MEIGLRQRGRSSNLHARVADVTFAPLLDAIDRALTGGRVAPSIEYGDGKSAERFVEWLAADATWSLPLQKTWTWV